MSIVRGLRYLYLAYLSQPKCERSLYRWIRRAKVSSILEIGIGNGQRAERMLEVAQQATSGAIRYTGIDYFEARQVEHGDVFPVKEAYRQLKPSGAQIRLLPGDAYSVLSRQANSLGAFDLVLISSTFQDDSLARAWFYVPRLLHPTSRVLLETVGEPDGVRSWRQLSAEEVKAQAEPPTRRKAA